MPRPDRPAPASARHRFVGTRATLRWAALLSLLLAGASEATSVDSLVDDGPRLPQPRAETFTQGLEMPWGMEFLPDGSALVTERAGRLRRVGADGALHPAPVEGLPPVDHRDHGGLLDVTIDPAFAANRRIYFSYTEAGRGRTAARNGLVVARARLSEDGTRIDDFKILFRQTPKVESGENLGGRLAASPDGYLFITLGDRRVVTERRKAQHLGFLQGKTARIRTDGSVPADNPFAARRKARPEIWSLGHRNPQGAFVHPDTRLLWVAEHGPFGGDEVNVVRKGGNYGWPVVTFGCEYDSCARIGEGRSKRGMVPPLTHWDRPSIAPSNLILYTGERLPQWKGNLLVGALAGTALWRLELADDPRGRPRVVRREALFTELGERIRDVRQGTDGWVYLLTDGGDGRILRIVQ